jgi:hypothetical protein
MELRRAFSRERSFVHAKFLVWLDFLVQSELKGSFFVSLLPLIVGPTVVSVQFVSMTAANTATALSNLATSFRVVLAILVTPEAIARNRDANLIAKDFLVTCLATNQRAIARPRAQERIAQRFSNVCCFFRFLVVVFFFIFAIQRFVADVKIRSAAKWALSLVFASRAGEDKIVIFECVLDSTRRKGRETAMV